MRYRASLDLMEDEVVVVLRGRVTVVLVHPNRMRRLRQPLRISEFTGSCELTQS